MAEIKVTPQHSASYIDSAPKKLDASLALPYVCVSYIGASDTAVAPAESTVTGTVASGTNIAQLSPANAVTYIDSTPKKLDASLALPYVCVSYVPASVLEVVLNVDLRRNTANVVTATFDTSRSLVTTQTVNVDTSRNTAVATSLNADSMRNVSKALTANFDTARKVDNAVNVNLDTARELASGFKAIWRYENYGSASLLKVSGTTVTGLDATKSKTGSAFWQKNRVATFDIPATKELWVKFDLYYGGTKWRAYDRLNDKDTGVGRYQQTNSLTSFINGPFEYTINPKNTIATNTLKTYLLHMVSDAENGIVELWVDGVKYYSDDFDDEGLIYKGNVENGADFANFYLQSDDANNLFSNVIISNARIGFGENVTGYNLTSYFDFDLAAFTTYSLVGNYDTKRNVSNTVSAQIDIQRNVTETANLNLDTLRDVISAQTFSEILNADACRILSNNVSIVSDIQRNITNTVDLVCDTRRRTEAVWCYENYGTAALLSVEGTTLTDLDKSQAVYKSAFYQTARAKCFDVPATKEIWIKCDVYCNLTNRWRIYNEDSHGATGICSQTSGQLDYWVNDSNVKSYSNTVKQNQLQTVLLHMVSDSSAGIVEAWLDGTKLYTYTGKVNNDDAFADIYLQSDGAGTFFSNVIISNDEIGLNENTTLAQNVTCDLLRFFPSTCLVSVDAVRNVLWQAPLTLDTYRFVTHSVLIDADLLSTVIYTVQLNCDAIRTLPHDFILSPVEELGGTPDTSNDAQAKTQSIEIRLNEQSLTDEVVIVTVKPVDIMEQVKGQYLDYKYNMRVETCKQRGILNTCTCCSDIDEILFKQLEYTIPGEELWRFINPDEVKQNFPGIQTFRRDSAPLIDDEDDDNSEDFALASTHIATIAGIIGKTPVLQFADFISTVDITSGGTTYNDLIRSIFGWTARIPQNMINCFLRDDKLFVVQRGFEEREINLSNLRGSEIVGVDKELMRTIWGSSVWSKTETREVFGFRYLDNLVWSDDDEESSQPSGSSKPSSTSRHNRNGLIRETTEYHNGVKTTTKYDYDATGLVLETNVYVESSDSMTCTTTKYEYITLGDGRKVLAEERIREEELINGHWQVVDEKITKHEYTSSGPGQVHYYTTDSNGNVENIMGSGTGDDRRTPYAKFIAAKGHKSLISYTSKAKYYQQQRTIYGLTPFDTSFPVHGDEKLIEITDAIKWLNRKTQETLTLNLFDYPHVIDFNDRVVINGNVYYLKGNTALKTPRIVNKQTLSLVRWY